MGRLAAFALRGAQSQSSTLVGEYVRQWTFEFDVALSFAGEDRGYVHPIAERLRERGIRVFYDDFCSDTEPDTRSCSSLGTSSRSSGHATSAKVPRLGTTTKSDTRPCSAASPRTRPKSY